jgi:DNA-directed RNA polymerase specialized sigma24 family protein
VKKQHFLTANSFEGLLFWLDPDRERAGDKYEQVRFKLIKIFARRGCLTPDELADETIDRVSRKIPEIISSYSGDRNLYFYGVAKNVYREYLKNPPLPQSLTEPVQSEQNELRHQCLEKCLATLVKPNREFILRYYQGDESERIDGRKKLAESLGVAIEALRMRAHRIKSLLQKCVRECVEKPQ